MIVVGFSLAALVGLSLGILGGGGSILTVPIFVYVLGFDPKLAIAMSLPVVGTASAVGALARWREDSVDIRTGFTFGVIAMIGSFAGARLAMLVTGSMQLFVLGVVMLAAAASMFRSGNGSPAVPARAVDGRRRISFGLLVPVALGVGMLTGLVGIGGGFLAVPALVLVAKVPMNEAVGTSLLVIAMNSAAGLAGHVGQVTLPWTFVSGFTGVTVIGTLAGTYLVRFISPKRLRQFFAVFLLFVGGFVLYQNRAAFYTETDGALHLGDSPTQSSRKQ
ncbi:MAG: sulfite exporter TauE/SafE family protein [Gemmatimonadaceae bacterium]